MSLVRTFKNFDASSAGQGQFYSSAAAEASKVLKAAQGTLAGFNVQNVSAAIKYVQIHNATALPADGAVPVFVVQVPANGQAWVSFGDFNGLFCTTGVVMCASTTVATKTVTLTADLLISAWYV